MIDWLLHPLTYAFMGRGLLAAVMVGVLCSVIGCYVVLRSMAFLGDAMAHAILPGIAIAYLFKGNLTIGALAAAVVVALGIGAFSQRGTIKEDTAISIMFTAALALGSPNDLLLTAILGATILVITLICYKPFLVITFDPLLASTLHLPVQFLRNLLLVLLALTIVTSMQTVGVGLVAAMLVTPGATAFLLTKRLPTMMGLAALLGAFSSLVGLYISYYLNIASGSTIVLTATLFFLLAYLFSPRKGVFKNWGRK